MFPAVPQRARRGPRSGRGRAAPLRDGPVCAGVPAPGRRGLGRERAPPVGPPPPARLARAGSVRSAAPARSAPGVRSVRSGPGGPGHEHGGGDGGAGDVPGVSGGGGVGHLPRGGGAERAHGEHWVLPAHFHRVQGDGYRARLPRAPAAAPAAAGAAGTEYARIGGQSREGRGNMPVVGANRDRRSLFYSFCAAGTDLSRTERARTCKPP
eukprot:355307-Prorocentrum_minimum.AAC.2